MYALEEDEWELLRQVQDVLKVMVFACGYLVARTTGPEGCNLVFLLLDTNLSMVIPAMDYIDMAFTTGLLKKERLDPTIRAALGLAKCTLNRYYSLADSSNLYQIAMGKSINFMSFHSLINLHASVAPSPQTRLLQASWVASRMGVNCS